ncbi:hypothetical protein PHAVU_001G073900 [Phaseolus vulgaris]|uniref:Uncharacterized protein n=1 Tax=Phaseolus vulgaris TaxID=3885 RepID=V7CTM0_PHAVU|nr:hypothetical protein PHAVU_001G073900g [Phaseolus vulgaris]ESW33489.1 hypothetical protein PHAVU_001G073900g [Phaseolus vulgaris]
MTLISYVSSLSYQLYVDMILIGHKTNMMLSEILIFGYERNIQHVDPELRRFIRSTGMKLEVVDSVSI